jgi:hypothetical protein
VGIPVLFTDTAGTPELVVKPLPGLWLGDETFLSDELYLDDGPTLQLFATAPAVATFGVTVSVTPSPATFDAVAPVLIGVDEVVVAVSPSAVLFKAAPPTLGGADVVVPVTPGVVTFGGVVPQTTGGQLLILVPSVRELPPLRLYHVIETPSGRFFRWGEDEPNPANVPSNVRFSDTMPGGFESSDATLPRKSNMAGADLEPLSTWNIFGAGGQKAWEGRIERAPRTSGDEVSVSPSAVGYQAALDDDKSVRMIYIDRDLGRWQGMSASRSVLFGPAFNPQNSGSVVADTTTGVPGLRLELSGHLPGTTGAVAESWYDAGPGAKVASVLVGSSRLQNSTNFTGNVFVSDDDLGSGTVGPLVSVINTNVLSTTFAATSTPKRWLLIQFIETIGTYTADENERWRDFHDIAVIGDHGLTGDGHGFRASDIVGHAVGRWAGLNYSVGPQGTVQPSGYFIPQMAFTDSTTASEIVKSATRFGLQDWAVWDDRTFWWHDRGATARYWRTRVGPAQLSETGPQVDRIFESTVVQFQDVDGSTRTVGPPGSGTDVEDPVLKDTDPDNPANEAGIVRRALLTMGTSTPAAAIEIGRRFLEEQKLLDGSGQARIVGHIESDRGVLHPYWAVRAGDYISFIDAADSGSPRRVVRSEKDHASRTCTVDLDAPPDSMAALLERLQVGIVDLGFGS